MFGVILTCLDTQCYNLTFTLKLKEIQTVQLTPQQKGEHLTKINIKLLNSLFSGYQKIPWFVSPLTT